MINSIVRDDINQMPKTFCSVIFDSHDGIS